MGVKNWAIEEWKEIRPHFKYDVYKWVAMVAGAAMLVLAALFMKSLRRIPDPIFYGVCFLLTLAAFVFMVNRLGRFKPRPTKQAVRSEIEMLAGGEAALLWHFSAQAKGLASILETAWHHWIGAGEHLIHPLSSTIDIKHHGENYVALSLELRQFKVLYHDHLIYLASELPAFKSRTLSRGHLSEEEYPLVLSDLKEHSKALNELAQQAWDRGRPMSEGK